MDAYYSEHWLEHFALVEWYNIREQGINRNTILKLSTSNLQCYCQRLSKDIGHVQAASKVYEMKFRGQKFSGEICKDYLYAENIIFYSIFAFPAILEGINFIVKFMTGI